MEDEWRYLVGSADCYINQAGEVTQNGKEIEPYRRHASGRHRWVDLIVQTNLYDYDRGEWGIGPEHRLVWQLMIDAWVSNWSSDLALTFLDDDPWNCSIENIRATSRASGQLVLVREDDYYFTFDKRLKGKVEIVELDQVFSGPADAAKAIGGTKSGVSRVLSGELNRHRGYHFRWVG